MKKQKQYNTNDRDIKIIRYRKVDLEEKLLLEHQTILQEVAIPLGKDLAAMNKPEPDSKKDYYSGVISTTYNKMMVSTKKELQIEIESHSIISDNIRAEREVKDLSKQLHLKENDYRLKKRELEKEDNTLLKRSKRYKNLRWFLLFIILVDTFLSSAALQAMQYSLIVSYVVGSALGIGIFLISEHLPDIINKGKTTTQKRMIALSAFLLLAIIFYVLGIFRSISVSGAFENSQGVRPIYFACLNMFFVIVTTLTVYFNKLTKFERQKLDEWILKKEVVEVLSKEIGGLREQIENIHSHREESELSRRQLLIYASDIQNLIQSYFEESLKTFYSTNLIHRSDGKTPLFFENGVEKLTPYNNNIKL
ncbi:MAG: hypothetical protein COB12_04725 [Flavobacterium sp.]|nr:MAG: hypothetical protein COB12_04725 [Flavobacterium sp.]